MYCSTSRDSLGFIDLVKQTARPLGDAWLYDSFNYPALWCTIEDLSNEGINVRQMRTILEADAYMAYLATSSSEGPIAAVLSQVHKYALLNGPSATAKASSKRVVDPSSWLFLSLLQDSDFIVFDCPFIPLDTIDLSGPPSASTCRFLPKGKFSSILYEKALSALCDDRLSPLRSKADEVRNTLCTLDDFRNLLPDYATLSGNDYFKPTGASTGFVLKPRIPVLVEGIEDRVVTFDVLSKEHCAQFLVVCCVNGWVDEMKGTLNMEALEPFLFTGSAQQKTLRKEQYIMAR